MSAQLLHDLPWRRREQPIFSAMTDRMGWRNVTVYNPTVIKIDGLYKMWFLGNNTATRTDDMKLGYAESEDGLNWREHSENPILTETDLPWGFWQTPHVLFDSDEDLYKMWFIMAESKRDAKNAVIYNEQRMGYATSRDGLSWDIAPDATGLWGRRPCVLKQGPGSYRMWMNSAPDPDEDPKAMVRHLHRHIFGFSSKDGITWSRDEAASVSVTETLRSVVYPFIHQDGTDYTMWYGCHVGGGVFEIYSSTSRDGRYWTHHHEAPSFGATRDPNHFDGRYTSTPCVLEEEDRFLLYYSARDWGNLYGAANGTIKVDAAGIYRHIGVATCERKPKK